MHDILAVYTRTLSHVLKSDIIPSLYSTKRDVEGNEKPSPITVNGNRQRRLTAYTIRVDAS